MLEDPETSVQLRWTGWPAQFAGRSLEAIAAAAVQPQPQQLGPGTDFVLGIQAGDPIASPAVDEAKLRQLVRLLDLLFDRCEATLTATLQLLRCWLNLVKSDYCP